MKGSEEMMKAMASWPFGHLLPEKASTAARQIAAEDLSIYCGDAFLVREFKRYLLIRTVIGRPITMQSQVIDQIWHAFILDTANYRRFCGEVFGEYLDHKSSHFPLTEEFGPTYEILFGESLPAIWRNQHPTTDGNCA